MMKSSAAHLRACARYRSRHRDKVRAANRKWNNTEKGRSVRSAWARSDDGKAWYRSRNRALRDEVLIGYGGACACCVESERDFMAIDHVNGGGRAERRKSPPGITFYNRIIRAGFPKEYRLLCHNCNTAIGLTGSCPHARRKSEAA